MAIRRMLVVDHHDKIKMERIEQNAICSTMSKQSLRKAGNHLAWHGKDQWMVDGLTGQDQPEMHPRFSQRLGWVASV